MKWIIVILVFIIVVLFIHMYHQHMCMVVQQGEIKQYVLRLGKQQKINDNLQKLLYFSNKMELIEQYMREQGINKIAIYGMGVIGKIFLEQMQKTGITICYGIDRSDVETSIEVRKIKDVKNDMDIIIVNPEEYYSEIRMELEKYVDVPIVMLSQFLYEINLIQKL